MISVYSIYKKGLLDIRRQKKMLFLLYGFNLLFAYLMSLTFSGMLQKALDHTIMADKLLKAFDFTALIILFDVYGKGVTLGWSIFVFIVFYLLLSTYFSGGVVRLLCSGMKFTLQDFLNGCTVYFARFFRLLVLSYGSLLVIFAIYFMIGGLLDAITANTTTEFWPFLLSIFRVFLLAIILAWFNMVLDYTKIEIVIGDSQQVYRSLKQIMIFIMKNFGATTTLYGFLLLTCFFLFFFI